MLDALRGFALLGILLANIRSWSAWGWNEEIRLALAGRAAIRITEFLNLMLVNGKFYTIFSLLFGVGFALQLTRLESRGVDGLGIFRKRLLLLMLIGLVHLCLIWTGDILTLYAALGFLLPLFRHWPTRRLLALAASLILLPIPGYWLVSVLGTPPDLGLYELSYDLGDRLYASLAGGAPPPELAWVRSGDWGAFFAWNLSGVPWRLGQYVETWRIPKVLGAMLIGLWAGRELVAGRLVGDRPLLTRIAVLGFAIGVPANAVYAAIGGLDQATADSGLIATTLYAIGIVPLGLAYAASFALAWRYCRRMLSILESPGRMALSNYLLQSVAGIAIFYGVGLGLAGRVPPAVIYALAVAIFAGQVVVSAEWLGFFRQGPMEWLWRLGTYRHWLPAGLRHRSR